MENNFMGLPNAKGQQDINVTLQAIASLLGVTTDALNSAIILANTAGNDAIAKIAQLETAFALLTTEQQQDSEVITARGLFDSLLLRLDASDTQLLENAEQINNRLKKDGDTMTKPLRFNGQKQIGFISGQLSSASHILFDTGINASIEVNPITVYMTNATTVGKALDVFIRFRIHNASSSFVSIYAHSNNLNTPEIKVGVSENNTILLWIGVDSSFGIVEADMLIRFANSIIADYSIKVSEMPENATSVTTIPYSSKGSEIV